MLKEMDFLSSEECQRVVSKLHGIQSFWTKRDKKFAVPFYTVGAASYLDATKDVNEYYELAQRHNILLESYFKWLYEKLKTKLEEVLETPVAYAERFALPGFHIFLGSKIFERPVASLHCDLQYELLDWEGKKLDEGSPISFTLPVKLPSGGGGLYVWDLLLSDTENMTPAEKAEALSESKRSFHPYKEGSLVMHSGHMYHQIAPMVNAKATDARITLQGHGIRSEGVYYLYW